MAGPADARHILHHVLLEQAPIVPVVGREPLLIPDSTQHAGPVRIDHTGLQILKMACPVVAVQVTAFEPAGQQSQRHIPGEALRKGIPFSDFRGRFHQVYHACV